MLAEYIRGIEKTGDAKDVERSHFRTSKKLAE